jgi:phosphate transport system substrate-binding protein
MRRLLLQLTGLGVLALLVPHANGQTSDAVRGPNSNPGAVLRIWGIGAEGQGTSPVLDILTKLEMNYRRMHPEVSFTHHLSGNDSALGGLYVGAADVVLMDRKPSYIELDGYQQVITGQKPLEIAVMRGGVQVGGHSSPMVVVVNKKNPLVRLTITELDAVFNAAHAPAGHQVRTWADLGLAGDWAKHPVNLYGFGTESDEASIFSKTVMADSRRWVCAYQEVSDRASAEEAAKRIVATIVRDPYALGLTTLDAMVSGAKVLAINDATGVARLPTKETLASGEYVLGRTVLALARADKDGHPESKVRDFLEYLMSAEAQAIISTDGSYVPVAEKVYASKEASR